MKTNTIIDYLLNCFLLLIPILIWNVALASKLPESYQNNIFKRDIPSVVTIGENFFRLLVMILPLLMPLSLASRSKKTGLYVFIIGTLIYFLSWAILIAFPQSAWSTSVAGFLAPAYTPFIWLVGIGLIGERLYFESPYRSWVYIALSIVFLSFHVAHATLAYLRLNS